MFLSTHPDKVVLMTEDEREMKFLVFEIREGKICGRIWRKLKF